MGNALIRAAQLKDVPAATQVFLTSLDDLRVRHNATGAPMNFDDWLPGYEHVFNTGVFNVAAVESEVVGVCNGVIRDKGFFFTGFWMMPGRQGAGVGGQLIRKTWADAAAQGAEEFFVWASIDWPALATYMKLGMLPGYQIFTCCLLKESFQELPEAVLTGYSLEPLSVELAGEFDRAVRGTARAVDHLFWQGRECRGRAVVRGGKPVGYFYTRKGTVGPLAFGDIADGAQVFNLALAEAFADSEKAVIYVPGINRSVLTALLRGGGKMLSASHFLSTSEFGNLANYLPSGPLLY
jgi:GNAT superfamily N-acetyltransferase